MPIPLAGAQPHEYSAEKGLCASYEAPHFVHEERCWSPRFSPLPFCGEPLPSPCDAVVIELSSSDGAWNEVEAAQHLARRAHTLGYAIFWQLDMGLFDSQKHPEGIEQALPQLQQLLRDWHHNLLKESPALTLGVCLFRGTLDSCLTLPIDPQNNHWQEWLKAHDFAPLELQHAPSMLRYHYALALLEESILLLMNVIPNAPHPFAWIDGRPIDQLCDFYHLAFRSGLEAFSAIWCPPHGAQQLPWQWQKNGQDNGIIAPSADGPLPRIGLCFPSHPTMDTSAVQRGYCALLERNIPFRPIAEGRLALSWNELDLLLVDTGQLSPLALRQLQGFAAAGGSIIPLDTPPPTGKISLSEHLDSILRSV